MSMRAWVALSFGAGGLHVFFTGGAAGGEVLLALVFLLRQFVLGALLLQLRLEVFDGELAGIEFGFLRGRVDFHEQLAFLDHVADFHMDLLDLPGCLGADVHITTWLQRAQRGDAAFDTPRVTCTVANLSRPGGNTCQAATAIDGNQTKGYEQGASGGAGTFHAGFRPVRIGPSFLAQAPHAGHDRTLSHGTTDTGSCPVNDERGKGI
jgi:hypothetical protein